MSQHDAGTRTSCTEIEDAVASALGMPAILVTRNGETFELVFAHRSRVTGAPISFQLREEHNLPSYDKGTISFVLRGERKSFAADVTRGPDGTLVASFPTTLLAS